MYRVASVIVGLVVALGLLLSPNRALAQGSSAARIIGVVKDASGAVLPGVSIEAASPSLTERVRTTVTDPQGAFLIPGLTPGTYTVTVTLPGFSTYKREGLDLAPNFTATLNIELKVGGLEETIMVSGETPLVDVSSSTQQKTISKALLDAVPTGKSVLGFAALMPSAVNPGTAQDVGGSMGESSVRISVHGAKQSDQKLLQDGMAYNVLGQGGTGRTFLVNPLGAQEVVIDLGSGGSAEYVLGGATVNLIPKDGGNKFSGTGFAAGTNHSLQSNNLTQDLQDRGLTSVNGVRSIYDLNGVLGGPLMEDKLWFMTAHRLWGRRARFANLYHDADTTDYIFTKDLTRPGDAGEDFRADNIRVTWQASQKNKFAFSYDYQHNRSNVQGGALASGTRSLEAITNPDVYCNRPNLMNQTWTNPHTNTLLFEAGASTLLNHRNLYKEQCGGDIYSNAIREQSTGLIYHGSGNRFNGPTYSSNERFTMTLLKGTHSIKTGQTLYWVYSTDQTTQITERGGVGFPVDYTLNNGKPTSLTEYVSPSRGGSVVQPQIGLFVQDQWRLNRLTLNYGLRYEYIRGASQAFESPEGILGPPATNFPSATCLPCWHDLNPRVAGSYDLFGDGKTALKAGIGRYSAAVTTEYAGQFGPSGGVVSSTTRSWSDANSNFYPDCDLKSPSANAECGAMNNTAFGTNVVNSIPDPNWITGWGKRQYNWRTSVEVDRQIGSSVAVNAGYYRTWWGNQSVTDNTLVSPSDYDPYCVTAPVDDRLGSISGSQICGLYDINPTQFGKVYNEVTLAKNFGTYSEVYNGADINFTSRFKNGATLAGGWNLGNSVNTGTVTGVIGITLGTNSQTSQCFVVDTPQQLYNCKSGNPYQSRFKFNGSYPLPWGMQTALVYQNLPGPNYDASTTFTTAQIQPSLGRPLAGGTRNVTIGLFVPNSTFLADRINQLDVRLSKIFKMGTSRFQANFDLYNLFNDSSVLALNSTYGPQWLYPTQVLDARLMKFSFQIDF